MSTTFAGIKRAHRRPLDKKTALVVDRLRLALEAVPETLPGLRDRALLLVGFAAALRPSEITEGPLFRRIWRLPPPRVPRGTRRKPVAGRYRIGTNPINTDAIALTVKNWTGLAGLDAAAFAGHSLRRSAISSGVAQGMHIARLKQFSGHASDMRAGAAAQSYHRLLAFRTK